MNEDITNAQLEDALRQQNLVEETTDSTETVNQTIEVDNDNSTNQSDVSNDTEDENLENEHKVEVRGKSKSERTAERFKKLLSKLNAAEQRIKELENSNGVHNQEEQTQTKDKYDEFIEFELVAQKLNATPEEKLLAWEYAKTHKTLPFKDCFVLVRGKNSQTKTQNNTKVVGNSKIELTKKIDYNTMPLNELENLLTRQLYS